MASYKADPDYDLSLETSRTTSSTVKGRLDRVPLGEVVRLRFDEYHRAPEVLEEYGACIFEGAANAEELVEGERLFWKFLHKTGLGINRESPNSMINDSWRQLGFTDSGVIASFGVGQSDFLWYCRQLPNVLRIFSTIWGTPELITSFDGCGCMRNPFLAPAKEDWYTKNGWYHYDQNANVDPHKECYQGLLNFFPVTEKSASTVIVPQSLRFFNKICRDKYRKDNTSDMVRVDKPGDFETYCGSAIQVRLNPGDFLVWDSRTIHCNQGIDRTATQEEVMPDRMNYPISRLVAYICMIPRARATEAMIRKREEWIREGKTGPHHPLKFPKNGARVDTLPGYKVPPKSSTRWSLI